MFHVHIMRAWHGHASDACALVSCTQVTRVGKIAIIGDVIAQAGLKRTAEQQAASTKADWLGKGIA